MRGIAAVLLVGTSMLVGGCGQDTGQTQADAVPATQADESASHDTHDTHDAAQDAAASATDAHAHGGTGEPRPLLPIMTQLGVDMVTLTHGLMADSAELVAHGAEAIAHHPPIAQEDIDRISRTLGAEMAEFERLDTEVHEGSVRLHEAARSGSTDQVLTILNEVQRGCVACHTKFRDRLRTSTGQ